MYAPLFGLETEFAISTRNSGPAPEPIDREHLSVDLFGEARARLVSLPDRQGSGLFLSNGARFYPDAGNHPELCSPECECPEDTVRWQNASERLLARLIGDIEKRTGKRMALYRCNVDYSGSGSTWGCHESYLHRTPPDRQAPNLVPFLASRIVYTGAGGFDSSRPDVRFVLSPRTFHLRCAITDADSRAIYNGKNEPLSGGGFSRLHLVCGESLCSQLSNYLKVGVTALIVRLIEVGAVEGERMALAKPVTSMRAFAADPSCRRREKLMGGSKLSAIEIQRYYLDAALRHLDRDFMPAFAPGVCRAWADTLDALERDPMEMATKLDWVIKYALLEDRLSTGRPVPFQTSRGSQLGEIDTRFGELGPGGLFEQLDAAGVLEHKLPGLGPADDAMDHAPPGGRAAARGRAIRELHGHGDRYRCDWDNILDSREHRWIDLHDPHSSESRWTHCTPRRRRAPDPPPSDQRELF